MVCRHSTQLDREGVFPRCWSWSVTAPFTTICLFVCFFFFKSQLRLRRHTTQRQKDPVRVCVSAGAETRPNTQRFQDRSCWPLCGELVLKHTHAHTRAHTHTHTHKHSKIFHPRRHFSELCCIGCIVGCKLALVKKVWHQKEESDVPPQPHHRMASRERSDWGDGRERSGTIWSYDTTGIHLWFCKPPAECAFSFKKSPRAVPFSPTCPLCRPLPFQTPRWATGSLISPWVTAGWCAGAPPPPAAAEAPPLPAPGLRSPWRCAAARCSCSCWASSWRGWSGGWRVGGACAGGSWGE